MRVIVAGTFGPIHDGHRALFREALKAGSDGVIVGLTSDRYARRTRDRPVPNFETRKANVREECSALNEWGREIAIHRIDSQFELVEDDPDIDAIVVSEETKDVVSAINERRALRGLDELQPIVVPLVRDEAGKRISSTRIVAGEVDEHGTIMG